MKLCPCSLSPSALITLAVAVILTAYMVSFMTMRHPPSWVLPPLVLALAAASGRARFSRGQILAAVVVGASILVSYLKGQALGHNTVLYPWHMASICFLFVRPCHRRLWLYMLPAAALTVALLLLQARIELRPGGFLHNPNETGVFLALVGAGLAFTGHGALALIPLTGTLFTTSRSAVLIAALVVGAAVLTKRTPLPVAACGVVFAVVLAWLLFPPQTQAFVLNRFLPETIAHQLLMRFSLSDLRVAVLPGNFISYDNHNALAAVAIEHGVAAALAWSYIGYHAIKGAWQSRSLRRAAPLAVVLAAGFLHPFVAVGALSWAWWLAAGMATDSEKGEKGDNL